MSAASALVSSSLRTVGTLSPALAGRMAASLFFSTRPRMRLREQDRATHESARREELILQRGPIAVYQWGAGARTALLMHGWSGRASQFATLTRDLVAEGFRVIAVDAPAHGESAGRRTDVRDWVDAAQHLERTDGPFDLVVGHSFGGFAALAAARAGIAMPRIVTISAAGTVTAFHDEFDRMLHLSPAVRAAFESDFHRRIGMTPAEAEARFDSIAHPLPASTELLIVHDTDDRALDARNSVRLHEAHPDTSELVLTRGVGHNGILGADEVLDAVLAFADGGRDAVAAQRARQIGRAR